MKRTLSILLALLMLVSLVPFHALAENVEDTEEVANQAQDQEEKQEVQEENKEEAQEEQVEKAEEETEISEEKPKEAVGAPGPNVTLVGQWVNESSKKEDTAKHYELTDKIGTPKPNGGLLKGLAKQFLVWSDKEPTANGVLPEGARIFSPEDKISDAFPNGIPEGAKLYAVYYEINTYGQPFNNFSISSLGSTATKLQNVINKNTVTINKNVKPEDVLKNTENHESGDKIVDYYKETDDDKTINEVTLKAEFEMDWAVTMLAYRNKAGSNAMRPNLSYDYFDRYKKEDLTEGFPTKDGKDAGYTYVDLNMNFGDDDDGLVIPDKLYLEFKSYSWRPLYAFGNNEKGEKIVLDGNYDVKKDKEVKPETEFNVKTDYTDANGNKKNYRNITVRVVLREWESNEYGREKANGERIPESSIKAEEGKNIAETIISNMTLRVMGSEDGLENKNIVRISDKKAKALAEGQGKEDIQVTGSIQGHVFASAGIFEMTVPIIGKISIPLKSDVEIEESKVKDPVKLSYVFKEEKPEPKPEPYDPGYWYEPSPDYLNKKPELKERTFDLYRWYVKGNEGDFMPYKGITRAEIAEIFARALDYDKTYFDDSHVNYPDVDESAWYAKAVARVTNAGIFKGTDEGNFEPTREITQGELISTLKRFQKLNDSMENIMTMRDDHWARAEVNAAAKEGWLKIYQDGTKAFDVDKVITREEVVAIANKAFARPVDQRYIDEYIDSLKTFKDINKDMWSYYEILTAANTYFVNYNNKDSRYDLWVNHATYDDGPTTAIEDIKTYKEILNNDEYKTKVDQVRFQRDLYR